MSLSKIFILLFSTSLLLLSACSKRAQCPAYMQQEGTLSIQDTEAMSPDEVREQSQKLLDTQERYIQVKRDKKTGLVKSKKKTKKGKNNTKKHKGFEQDPRLMKGIKNK